MNVRELSPSPSTPIVLGLASPKVEWTSAVFVCQAHFPPPSCNSTLVFCCFPQRNSPPHSALQVQQGWLHLPFRAGIRTLPGPTKPHALASEVGLQMGTEAYQAHIPKQIDIFVGRDDFPRGVVERLGPRLGWVSHLRSPQKGAEPRGGERVTQTTHLA